MPLLRMWALRFRKTASEGLTRETFSIGVRTMALIYCQCPDHGVRFANTMHPAQNAGMFFSIQRCGILGVMIEARVHFWDRLYEKLGICRSAKEERSRNDLLRYFQMVQVPPIVIKPEHMRSFTLHAQVSAMRFALRRGKRDLDSLQTYLRDAIFHLGCYGLHEYGYDAGSYEDRKVPLWCYQVDRIERGLSSIILATNWLHACDNIDDQESLLEYSRAFNRELRQLVSGPWRRTLFAEAGGDRDGLRWTVPSYLLSDPSVPDL